MCDGPNMLNLEALKANIEQIKKIKDALGEQ